MAFKRVIRALKVDREIARVLSRATYHQLVLALREIVANAHDANASKIDITVKLAMAGKGILEVVDDGDGMDERKFNGEFLTLGSTSKTPRQDREPRTNRFGRQIIGQFGIGFISTIPFADEIVVETRDRDDEVVRGAKIDCKEILAGTAEGTETTYRLEGWDRPPDLSDARSFTRVSMRGLTKQAYDSIDSTITGGWYQTRSQRTRAIQNDVRLSFLRNWTSRILPLGYDEVHTSDELRPVLRSLLPERYIPARVTVNGIPVFRSLANAKVISDPFHLRGEHWEAHGVLWSPQETINPVYNRGIAIRIGDMSIGEPGYLGLSKVGRVYGKLQHIAGEVQVKGLESNLQLDRQDFYFAQATDEFLEQVRREVTSFESKLQKKAHVMQKFRNLSKTIKKQRERGNKGDTVAEILEAPKLLKALELQARAVGISVEKTKDAQLEVPQGERRVRIGERVAEDLLLVRIKDRDVQVIVTDNKTPMDIGALVGSVTASTPGRIVFTGPHRLISEDEWALANVRWLVGLQVAYMDGHLTRDQIRWILETVTEAFKVRK